MAVEILRNPCDTVARVVTQVMGARYEVRTAFELVTQIAGDISCHKLSSLKTGSTLRTCGVC